MVIALVAAVIQDVGSHTGGTNRKSIPRFVARGNDGQILIDNREAVNMGVYDSENGTQRV